MTHALPKYRRIIDWKYTLRHLYIIMLSACLNVTLTLLGCVFEKMTFLLLILQSSFNFVIFDGNFCDTKGNRFGFSFSKAVNMK